MKIALDFILVARLTEQPRPEDLSLAVTGRSCLVKYLVNFRIEKEDYARLQSIALCQKTTATEIIREKIKEVINQNGGK